MVLKSNLYEGVTMLTYSLPIMISALSRISPSLTAMIMEYLAMRPRGQQVPKHRQPFPEGEWVTFRFGQRALRWGQQGIPVLAVHGWQGHPDQFRPIACALVGQGYQVFALNGPGHGEDTNGPVHPGLFADYIEDIVTEIGGIHALIGHSMGAGASIMALAAGVSAQQAVIIGAPYSFISVVERLLEQFKLTDRARLKALARIERRVGYVFRSMNGDHLLPPLDIPLLVVHDKEDRQVSFNDAERIVQRAPVATLHATEGQGHGRILQSDDVVVRIVEFLRQ